jgi:hypothetical protein
VCFNCRTMEDTDSIASRRPSIMEIARLDKKNIVFSTLEASLSYRRY